MNPVPTPTVLSWLAGRFPIPQPTSVELIRAYTNDVYLVRTAQERYVLKLYGPGWRTEPEIRYELALLDHLASSGVTVALAIGSGDPQAVQPIEVDGLVRHAVLFAYAPGAKPQPPFSPALYEHEGRAVAAMHQAANTFVTAHPRPAMDERFLLDRPRDLIEPHLTDAADRHFFRRFVAELRARIGAFAERGLDWGPCHGDVTLDNFHLTDDGQIVWYDFDSGGPGWRAGDLQGWAKRIPDASPLWDAFLRGYQDVRPLAPVDLDAAPALCAAVEVWGITIDLRYRVLPQVVGDQAVRAYLAHAMDSLRSWATCLGFRTTS